MSVSRRVDIRKQSCLFDDVFKINELIVSHERSDGSMSADQRRLVFERGDSVAVLLFNRDTKCVVLVDQFRAPTLGKARGGGWITEAAAGMIDPYETPVAAAVRETMEETGYRIGRLGEPIPVATFFSSPGGTSERILLYYAEVGEIDKVGSGGGGGDEDIEVRQIPLDELFERLKNGEIEDAKLLIAAMWLQEDIRAQARRPLDPSTVKHALSKHPELVIGYKTGPISDVKDVSVWVNSENEDMIMDRFIGRSISANIRYLGAGKDESNNVTEDIINDELISAIGHRRPVRIGTVIETGPGALAATHGVQAVFHVATVRGVGAGQGFRADLNDLARCTKNVLHRVHERNQRFRLIRRMFGGRDCRSIVIPMLGAGDGGLQIEQVVPKLFTAAVNYFEENPATTLKEVYFLAFTAGHKSACDRELARLRKDHIIV